MCAQPAEPSQQAATAEDAVRQANQDFYAAFESLNLAQMEALWAHDDAVECVQPGWDLLLGWEEVRGRWERIFANTSRARVALTGVYVRVEGTVGWAACTVRVTTATEDDIDEAVVQTTNIFVLPDGQWLVAAHHASVLPSAPEATVQ